MHKQDTGMDDLSDRLAIIEVVQAWAMSRDSGDWDRLRATLHPEATMAATWYQGPFDKFIEEAQASFAKGARSMHVMGGSMVSLAGNRAVALSRMMIMVRNELDGVLVDVTATGRFHDRFEKRGGEWRIAKRDCIYDKDRMDPVDPSASIKLDPARLAHFPDGYRHLAYLQSIRGQTVNPSLPVSKGAALDAVLASGRAWLAGSA